jgi:hypothetical protein
MKENLEGFQHFNYKPVQWEPKSSYEEASKNHNFVLLRRGNVVVSASPHNRHIPKVPSPHVFEVTLLDGRFSENCMTWSPGSILRIFASTFYVITVTVTSIFKQALQYLKGKCALEPFLSILVIECQHKCLNVNLCPWMDKVQIKSKGMFLSL